MSPEELKRFNNKLFVDFGYFHNGQPKFRLVWSEDQFEKRLTAYTPEGLELLTPEVREFPKYRQWIQERYILEKLCVVPEEHEELTTEKLSYEPLWTFQDKKGDYLEPRYEAAKMIAEMSLLGPRGWVAKYARTTEEERRERIEAVDKLEELLFGEETKISDALARDSAVGYGVRQRNDGFHPTEKINSIHKQQN